MLHGLPKNPSSSYYQYLKCLVLKRLVFGLQVERTLLKGLIIYMYDRHIDKYRGKPFFKIKQSG